MTAYFFRRKGPGSGKRFFPIFGRREHVYAIFGNDIPFQMLLETKLKYMVDGVHSNV
jgi:hypothetical protein